jgi:hypothetical protein
MKKNPWAYFAVDTDPKNKKRKALFNTDGCENCGVTVLAPNSVWGFDSVAQYKRWGMTERNFEFYESLEELGYSEVLDMAVCPKCYDEAEAGKRVSDALDEAVQGTALDAGDNLALDGAIRDMERALEYMKRVKGIKHKPSEWTLLKSAHEAIKRAEPVVTNILFNFVEAK